MTRWAIYARYSDEDKQNARSIDDQVRDCRAAVRDQSEFTCHEDPENKRLCGGWCRAVQRKEV